MSPDALTRSVRAFVEELVRAGVRDVILAPGSRSTPLALAVAAHDALRLTVLLDERSAAFAALGLARAARRPVAVVVTSGTAVAELLPAVAEASLARVPLLLLTADRPAELRDRGAPQTIDQVGIFGSHVRWAAEAPVPDDSPQMLAHLRWLAGRAVAEAVAGPRGAGPVHLDLPYREPLVPSGPLGPDPALADAPYLRAIVGSRTLDAATLDELARRIAATPRGLLLAGPDDDPELPAALAALAAAAGWPIVADPLSGLRAGPHDRSALITRGDQVLRPGPWIDAHAPSLVLRTGAMPTGKPATDLLARVRPETWIVDGDAGWREAALVPALFLHADPPATLHALADRVRARGAADGSWLAAWHAADARVDGALLAWHAELSEPFEGSPFLLVPDLLPDGGLLWVGSSMPVRDLDGWLPASPRALRILSSRGANGIDGVTSAAVGAALAGPGPALLVTGDVAFLHDVGALVSARLAGVALTILVIDNDGGGIFSFLPQAATDRPEVGLPQAFERLFGTPHGIDLAALARGHGASVTVATPATLRADLAGALADRSPGIRVVLFRSDRAGNVGLHREAAAVAAAALGDGGGG